MKEVQEDKFIVSVKVGPKGQITVPVEARKMFDIKEGDTLMVSRDLVPLREAVKGSVNV